MKKKWIAFGIVAALLIAVLVIVLRFTKKQTTGIADGKYMVVDCPEYPDAYIIVKNNSIRIYNIDVNAIYRNEQVESIKKICEDKESGIVLTGEEIEELSDLNKMFVENAYKVDVEKGTKEGTYSYVYSCLSKGNYFGLHFVYDSYNKTIKINNYQKEIVFKK